MSLVDSGLPLGASDIWLSCATYNQSPTEAVHSASTSCLQAQKRQNKDTQPVSLRCLRTLRGAGSKSQESRVVYSHIFLPETRNPFAEPFRGPSASTGSTARTLPRAHFARYIQARCTCSHSSIVSEASLILVSQVSKRSRMPRTKRDLWVLVKGQVAAPGPLLKIPRWLTGLIHDEALPTTGPPIVAHCMTTSFA